MEVVLIRHAQTQGNLEKRYIGVTDEPLCRAGVKNAVKSGVFPMVPLVYASPKIRAVQTATIKFPNARIVTSTGLREMDFGLFEGRNADEMSEDIQYRAWVAGGCLGNTPQGEGRTGFTRRVCVAFAELIGEAIARGHRYVVVVAHGGTLMAVMERFARPPRGYYDWHAEPAGGFRAFLDEETWGNTPILYNAKEI
ncbi:MAG: histidine phosphatase family protein [Oscillospiraceae bacterium]|nr:histidine phosphatase family protein [Oscillospiraceae bacterium]